MAIVTGDRYLELLSRFIEQQAGNLLDGTLVLKLNPVGLHYLQTRLEALQELEQLRNGAPVDYLRAYIADLGDHRALEKLRRVLRLLGSLQVVAVLPSPARDPTPITLLPFTKLKSLELRGCDLSTSAARGLLELRPILEKLICHNSVNALRHIFAEQVVEINVAQKWSRLATVACPCNGLVLLDESLQLLPAVEALDLSRNNFSKVANLQKCTRLKFLDLGFNHISSVALLNQVVSTITKLVLRNNALISARGIETLHSLEALDLSHNIISNFHEMETLGFLPVLQSVWLNGNPISVSSHYREEVFSYFHDPSKLEVDGKPMTKLESLFMYRILSRRTKQRATYGIYVPAKSSDASIYDAGQSSEAILSQPRQTHKKKSTRLVSIDDTGESKHCGAIDSAQQDVQASSAEPESALPGKSEVREQVDPEVAQLIKQIENMKREGSSTWLNDLVGFWESGERSPGRDDQVVDDSDSGSWSQRERRGKEEVRRKLEDVTAPKDHREVVHVLQAMTRPDIEDRGMDHEKGSMSSWQIRNAGNNEIPASPPHYDSALMHRRQSLVNEMLRLPLDLSTTSSDSDSDSLDGHQVDSLSDRTSSGPNSPSSVVDKHVDSQELIFRSPEDVDIGEARTNKDNCRCTGTTSPMHLNEELQGGSKEKGYCESVSVIKESPSSVQSPPKNDDVANSGGSGRKRKLKSARRIIFLDPENDAEEFMGLKGPLLSSRSSQADKSPQIAVFSPSIARNLSQQLMSDTVSPPNVKRSSSTLVEKPKCQASSPVRTVNIVSEPGKVSTSQRITASELQCRSTIS